MRGKGERLCSMQPVLSRILKPLNQRNQFKRDGRISFGSDEFKSRF